ncbi:hypothetical protein LCGC14_2118360 [marine sediment metagenome]|uniref:Uncharacterized protein n=1 Tax=marine sediment metagenome TaxID=412755 RepID=A0A0F9E4Z9_9ZZZZ
MGREKIRELLQENQELWAAYSSAALELCVSGKKTHKKLQADKDIIAKKIVVCVKALNSEIDETISSGVLEDKEEGR